ncbi:MAG: hypothetical protein KF763_21000 [Cyclobacteriaceae bacterium]|nr:hypothetical protein [Cyclobacteriaceae bacterium]
MPDSETDKTPFSFKKFLEENTNLLTVFAIFNALIVFSVSIKENEIIQNTLTVCFWVFSLLTFLELFTVTINTYKENRFVVPWGVRLKLSFFLYAVVFTQLALIAYFTILYPFIVGYIIVAGLSIGFLFLTMWINLGIDGLILKMRDKWGWSDKTVRILKKINNWSILGLMTVAGLAIIYFNADKS